MKPYYETELGRLYNANCLEVLPELKQVDLAITSPPFNLGNKHHTGIFRHSPYSDNLPEKEYQKQQIDILTLIFGCLSDSGSLFYQHKNRIKQGQQLTPYRWLLKTPFIIKQELVWFNRSQNFDKIRFYPMTERIYWLSKNIKTNFYNNINHHDFFDTKEWPTVGTKGNHTRAFPVKMGVDILNCFPKDSVVLDPFMGSGTTATACERFNRRWVGIEISEQYCEIAAKRIENEREQLKMF